MGSWNETCCLSNLPITDNDEVYAFLLKKISGFTSKKSSYIFVCPPIEGIYNGYGCLNEIKDIFNIFYLYEEVAKLQKDNIKNVSNVFENIEKSPNYHILWAKKDLFDTLSKDPSIINTTKYDLDWLELDKYIKLCSILSAEDAKLMCTGGKFSVSIIEPEYIKNNIKFSLIKSGMEKVYNLSNMLFYLRKNLSPLPNYQDTKLTILKEVAQYTLNYNQKID